MIDAVHVIQRKQIAVVHHFPTLCILQRELHATELCTLPTVGTAAEAMLRGITEAGITHTERTMHKNLEFDIRHLTMDLADFLYGELAGQHYTREAHITQPTHFLGGTVVGLGGGVERYRGERYVLQQF